MSEARTRDKDPLTAALLPVLLHRLNNATQFLQTLGSLAGLDPERDWASERCGDLADTAQQVEDLGYVLAVLASAGGADLLQERREARGLVLLVDAARDALRRERRRIVAAPDALPELAHSAGHGWEAPWAVGAMLLAAGRDGDAQVELRWAFELDGDGAALVTDAQPGAALQLFTEVLAARAPELRPELDTDRARLVFPDGWLVFRA